MIKSEIALKNIGKNLEELSHLDPRGYGVCKILQKAAYEKYGEIPVMNAARRINDLLRPGDNVFLLTGFVLAPFNKAETDGIAGAVSIAASLIKGYKVKPIIICPKESIDGIKAELEIMLYGMGKQVKECKKNISELKIEPEIIAFTKDKDEAKHKANELFNKYAPKLCVCIEAPGENIVGIYHNAKGENVTELEAKLDYVFEEAKSRGMLTISIGDLGNEIGMGALKEYIVRYIPYTGIADETTESCKCGCGKGTMARTEADIVVTATVSDWGGYALSNALALLREMPELAPKGEVIEAALKAGAENRLIDMFGEEIPAVDGCSMEMNVMIGSLMNQLVNQAITENHRYEHWFNGVERLGYFGRFRNI